MITGRIEDGLHPQIQLKVFGSEKVATFTMLVDTGFDENNLSITKKAKT
jgi:predicted aspartyl protease